LKIIERHILDQIIGLILSLIHQGSPCCYIKRRPYRLGHAIVEGLDNHPFSKAMVRAQPQQVFELLPSFIEHLIIPLGKVSDLVPQTCRLTWWEKCGKKGSSKLTLYGDASGR